MSRWLKRYHQRRCTRKAGFPTAAMADEQAEQASHRTGELIISYQCYDCGKWHIGHADNVQLAARNMSGPHITFCSVCGRPIPAEIADQADHKNHLITVCSPRCQKKDDRRRADQQDPPEPGSQGSVPSSS